MCVGDSGRSHQPRVEGVAMTERDAITAKRRAAEYREYSARASGLEDAADAAREQSGIREQPQSARIGP